MLWLARTSVARATHWASLTMPDGKPSDILTWWKARDHSLPADTNINRPEGLPRLAPGTHGAPVPRRAGFVVTPIQLATQRREPRPGFPQFSGMQIPPTSQRQHHEVQTLRQASSARAERLFSAASRAHHDLKGAMADNSLEHELLALANTD